jgi:hypothetical protein
MRCRLTPLRGIAVAVFAVGFPVGADLLAQGREAPARQAFSAGTTAVTIDVVVRDKRGKPVTDLTRADFQLREDGVLQDIADVTLAPRSTSTGPASVGDGGQPGALADPAPPGAPTSVAAPTFLALCFDRLSPEGRALAYKGAQAYLETGRGDDFAGVFSLGSVSHHDSALHERPDEARAGAHGCRVTRDVTV